MPRRPRKGARPIRAFVYAVLIHVAFGAMLGVTLWVQPRTLKPIEGKPVQAKAIDLAAIEREKQRIAAEKKKAEEEKKRKEAEKKKKKKEEQERKRKEEEKKKKAEEEKKRKEEEERRKEAEKKKKEAEAEAEEKRKEEEKKQREKEEQERKKREAEEKERIREAEEAQRQQDEQDAVSAFGAVAWAIQEQVRSNWNPPAGDFNGMSVSFTIRVDRDGNVTSVEMSRSSGNARLDESAENAIFKASPLPIPSEARFYEYLKEFEFVFSPQS